MKMGWIACTSTFFYATTNSNQSSYRSDGNKEQLEKRKIEFKNFVIISSQNQVSKSSKRFNDETLPMKSDEIDFDQFSSLRRKNAKWKAEDENISLCKTFLKVYKRV